MTDFAAKFSFGGGATDASATTFGAKATTGGFGGFGSFAASAAPSTAPAAVKSAVSAPKPAAVAAPSSTTRAHADNQLSVVSSAAAAEARDYFGENLKRHPVWKHLAATSTMTLPTAATAAANQTADEATPSTPFESRMAASFASTLFVLAPPPSPSTQASSGKNARLYYLDLKPLKTSHLQSSEEQAAQHSAAMPAFRELVCTPSPLPAHSHTIQLNSQSTYAAVHSTNTVYLVCIAANKMEKAVMYSDANRAKSGDAQVPVVKVKSAAVGSWFHQNNTSQQHRRTRENGATLTQTTGLT